MDFPLVLDADMFPVQAFFNAMPSRDFVETLRAFSRGVGVGFNDAVCEFPGEVGFDEGKFEGVKLYIFSEELVVSGEHFFRLLNDAAEMYLAQHPKDLGVVKQLMQAVAEKLETQ
ncbi:hypothetical protein K4L06_00910 [Lysobacter sp. BMK333-48F3]|uniref:ribonuclease toxin immunity protein CdiI n=1 Tax=Lysobacter sp. BMK333-48F3 TaxID=2867962 RepID=UPI001C8CACBF|nr:ribonuclease toxin immunity protein CdiI [Lysobacter sp. BMK333-48F3]MBX9399853.1 hypothetical protein [Lysobacter sp. BMK333-48F3]